MDFENYRSKLIALKAYYLSQANNQHNEADTRFKYINDLLTECLGWEKDDLKLEEPAGPEYTDYTCYINGTRSLILEAKKEGIYFQLPAGFDNRTEYKLSSLIRDNPAVGEAINQVIGYCNKRGVEIAAVSNGHQLIVFLAHRSDGVPPLDGKGIVFSSFAQMEKHFFLLWQVLSKPAIVEKRVVRQLQKNDEIVLPLKLSTRVDGYPGIARRNELQTDLQIVSEVILENVNKAEDLVDDFLKETYCSSGALSQYALVSKSILTNRYALLFENNTDAPVIKEAFNKKGLSPEVFGESMTSRPILLIGDVGAGKSMFINYFMRIEATELIKKSFTLYIDLGSQAALVADLKEFFLDECIRLFSEKYGLDLYERNFVRGVYNLDLIQFSKGIYGDLKETDPTAYLKEEIAFLKAKIDHKSHHLKASIAHISKGQGRQVIIFMDNVDQRDEEIQEKAFLIANEVASNWMVTVFITLRPTTFYKSKKEGALTGYHPKAFTISPPRIDEVIMKRLIFAQKVASGEVASESLSTVFAVKLHTLTQFLEILIHSFEVNRDLIELIDNLPNTNVRKAVEYLTTFIGSSRINTRKILELDIKNQNEGRGYVISVHEFLRAIIYKENYYYFPDTSDIVNVFDVTTESKEHFLILIMLDYLLRHSSAGTDGFQVVGSVISFLQDQGFKYNQIEHAILKCTYKGVIETEARKLLKIGDVLPSAIRLTTIGSYHLQKITNTFEYLDAVIIDIPIFDNEFEEKIREKTALIRTDADHILRLERCLIFCDYLDNCWQQASYSNVGYNWEVSSKAIRETLSQIRTRIEK